MVFPYLLLTCAVAKLRAIDNGSSYGVTNKALFQKLLE